MLTLHFIDKSNTLEPTNMNAMNKWTKTLLLATAMGSTLAFSSCLDDDDNYYTAYNGAIVTAKTDTDGTFYLQLDDSTTVLPVNIATSPFGDKEVRALMNFDFSEESAGKYDQAVTVYWMDSVLTKPMATDLGEKNDSVYGTDPIEIVRDWVNIAEDGYLTLHFRTVFGNGGTKHMVSLLPTNNPENPYEVELRHNAYGDTYGEQGDGMVAFRLDALPDTQGNTVKLKLIWQSYSGEKSTEFDYRSRKE